MKESADWPLDPEGFTFLGRAVCRLGQAKNGSDWIPGGGDDTPSQRDLDVFTTLIQALEAEGGLSSFYREPTGEMVSLPRRLWRRDQTVWLPILTSYHLDLIDLDASIPASERWKARDFYNFPPIPVFVGAEALLNLTNGSAPPPSPANTWRVRVGEKLKAWAFREDVLAEAHRRLPNASETKLGNVLEGMAHESGAGWTADSITSTRRSNRI